MNPNDPIKSETSLLRTAGSLGSEVVMLRLRETCRRLQTEYETGRITKRLVMRKLRDLESDTYKVIPDAEPDGEITYCVASTVDAIESAQHSGPSSATGAIEK